MKPTPQTLSAPASRRGVAAFFVACALAGAWGSGLTLPSAQAATNPLVRPQLDDASAARYTASAYLAQGATPWRPEALDALNRTPDFTVATDGTGTHTTVQAAVDAVPSNSLAAQPSRRWVIHIRPGEYRGPVCVKDKVPLALLGLPGQVQAVRLVDSRYNSLPKRAGIDAAHACVPNLGAATHGTSGSATVVVASADVLLADLTIANDATAKKQVAQGAQAVALMTLADRVQLENVRLLSHQDTFYVKRPAGDAPARVFVRASLIAGDVDFVFGNATLVIDDSTLLSRAGRLPAERGGHVLAPSTPAGSAYGFLVQRSRLVAEAGVAAGSTSLGRAWDEGVPTGSWAAGVSPNGQALIRDSMLGPHLAAWAASTSGRPFRAPEVVGTASDGRANRLAEYHNSAAPADFAREVLGPHDGWAAQDGGTRGGADAAPADVHTVRNRAELVAALAPHDRPRIVQVLGRIDLSVDDAGKPLTAEDFRDRALDWTAYEKAYDPATWGRQAPQGDQEEARRNSARNQAARVVMRVPSRTTIVGQANDAHIVNGSLMLDKVHDVIVRNLHLSDAYDYFPVWDPKDNGHGEWNSEYDNISLRGATHVWVDHCTLDDGDRPDSAEPTLLGRRMQRHDGLLDSTRSSNYVTVSWNHLRGHDKTSLVGGSDQHVEDIDRLKITFHHNHWEQTKERSPRVRHGQVHVFNNLYRIHDAAAFGYSLGVGHRADILSENNAWLAPSELPPQRLVRRLGNGRLRDQGSLLNGTPISLSTSAAPSADAPTEAPPWRPPYRADLDDAADVAARVRAGAGAGRLWVPAPSPGATLP